MLRATRSLLSERVFSARSCISELVCATAGNASAAAAANSTIRARFISPFLSIDWLQSKSPASRGADCRRARCSVSLCGQKRGSVRSPPATGPHVDLDPDDAAGEGVGGGRLVVVGHVGLAVEAHVRAFIPGEYERLGLRNFSFGNLVAINA